MSIQCIASTFAKPAPLLAAETQLRDLERHRDAVANCISKVRERLNSWRTPWAERNDARSTLRRREDDLARTNERLLELRREIESHRPIHAAAVRAALRPHREAAAQRVLLACKQLTEALDVLDATQKAIEQSGGAVTTKVLRPPFLAAVADMAMKIEKE